MASSKIDRRAFLKAAGVCIALPALESLPRAGGAAAAPPPQRMVCVGNEFGMYPGAFWPAQAGADYELTTLLKPLESFRRDFTLFSHLDHGIKGGHYAIHAFLTGVKAVEAKGMEEGGISLDQRAAEFVGSQARFPSLAVGSEGGTSGGCQMSWTRSGTRIPPIPGPRELFRLLFVDEAADERAKAADRVALEGSILDVVLGDARALGRHLSKPDSRKLDEYLASVRDVETKLSLDKKWQGIPKPRTKIKEPENQGLTRDLPTLYDLIALALQTDSTRVATLEVGGTFATSDLGIPRGYHNLSHHGQRQETIDLLVQVELYQVQQFARFLEKLQSIREPGGDGTLLDHTMVLLGSGMGNANSHVNTDLPIILAGGGFRHGEHKSFPQEAKRRVPLCNLYVSMLQHFGVETDRFGTSTGTLTGLERTLMPGIIPSPWLPCLFLAAAACSVGPLRAGEDTSNTRAPAAAVPFDHQVKPLLSTYCVGCHGPEKQKGDRRFDRLDGRIADDDALVDLQDILDQLNLGDMPPKKAPQPSPVERQQAVAWLTGRIADYHREHKPAHAETVLRRLNVREYRNTLRDLLHLNMTMFDPTAGFPRDQTTQHVDNVGETLVTSGPLLQRYLATARQAVDKVLATTSKPPVQTWTFRGDFRQGQGIDGVHLRTNGLKHMTLYEVTGSDKIESAYGPILAFQNGVPFDGTYEIRFKAGAVNRLHPYDLEFIGINRDEPFRLGIVSGNVAVGPLHKPQPIEPLLAEVVLADEPRWFAVRVWLDAGHTPRFTFPNGMMDVRKKWTPLVRKYADQFPAPVRGGIAEARLYAIKDGKLPQVQVHEVEIKGPFLESWPTAGQRAVLGDDWEAATAAGVLSDEAIRRHLTEFTARAYRRPAQPEELDRLLRLIALRRQSGRSPLEAYRDGLCAVLCAAGFLYLDEPGESHLSAYALASRLSYFLWSSMPDQPLLDLAASGALQEPEVLTDQARRMLADPRAAGFIEGFLDSWLALRDLGSMPPDRVKFEEYYRYDLQASMLQETRLFTQHLLANNLSIANFLDSDFTFVDAPLARHYGLTPPAAPGFAKVQLGDRRRGGLLGQASVLTVTANGIDTSPVVRGIWLLENILGTPPSPPPPDVEPLDPDVRGATTIREQLEKHRKITTCYECHRKIDPPGFALENFDAIGAWRDRYEPAGNGKEALPVDPAGQLSDGRAFADVTGLKELLGSRLDQFARCLTEKLLTYSLGRTLAPADRPEVSRIVAEAKSQGYGLRGLLLLVVQSQPFQSR